MKQITGVYMNIVKLLDIEKDLRIAESFLLCCDTIGGLRNMNCCKNEGWFSLMEELGFLVEGSFLPIIDIINKTKDMTPTVRAFTLESVGCDLSLITGVL
jgi:hypothetical protein